MPGILEKNALTADRSLNSFLSSSPLIKCCNITPNFSGCLKITSSADARVFPRPSFPRRRKALGTRLCSLDYEWWLCASRVLFFFFFFSRRQQTSSKEEKYSKCFRRTHILVIWRCTEITPFMASSPRAERCHPPHKLTHDVNQNTNENKLSP